MNRLKKLLAVIAGILTAALVFFAGRISKGSSGKNPGASVINTLAINAKHEEVKHEIENTIIHTPAADLVDTAVNTEQLRANSNAIADNARQRLRDRARQKLSGNSGTGIDGNSGGRN